MMQFIDPLTITGHLTATLHQSSGEIVDIRRVNNSITTEGRQLVRRLYNGDLNLTDPVAKVTQMRVGTDSTAFDASQTGLLSSLGDPIEIEEYTDLEHTDEDGTPRKQLLLTATLDEDECNGELHEAGLFTADDVMYNRVTFATITKSDQFKLTLVWKITF
jgi:hypothetical protein